MTLSSRLSGELFGTLVTATDHASPSGQVPLRQQLDLGSGTGAGLADKIWADRRTLAASATEDLDLTGTLTDMFGAAITLARVKGLFLRASASNTNNVVFGNATSNAWATLLGATSTLTLRPGAWIVLGTGLADAVCYAVTAGTGDLLKIANSGAGSSVTYDVGFVGASA